jgi:hypothetical protein
MAAGTPANAAARKRRRTTATSPAQIDPELPGVVWRKNRS